MTEQELKDILKVFIKEIVNADSSFSEDEIERLCAIFVEKMVNFYNVKFHPSMAVEQEIIDGQTENPIDISNTPEDADHDFNYRDTIEKE